MTNEEIMAVWAANIDSVEKFNEALNRTYNYMNVRTDNYTQYLPQRDGTHLRDLQHGADHTWPLRRDYIREQIGFYPEPTSVLKWMRTIHSNTGVAQKFPHVARQDKNMIAFSNDAVQAKADRKRMMSVGRFLREHLLFVPDSEIQRLEQQHRTELDDTFLLAETVQAIEEVYENMEGDTGCMRYGRSNFNLTDYHPSAVYCSPNMAVAYTQDEDGNIKSRSVVWTNPNDPDDKRYVRVYGDVILKRKLERAGYRMRGLAGAKLSIYKDSSFNSDDTMVMPWIDPAGGIHATNVDRNYDSEYAIRYKGESTITLVDNTTRTKLERAGIYCVNVQTQNGKVDVPLVDMSTFEFTCPLSGKLVNRMNETTVSWIGEDGTVGRVSQDGIDACVEPLANLIAHIEGQNRRAICTKATKAKWGIPGYEAHFNDEPTRSALGICELDKTFYAESERWGKRSECVHYTDALGARTYIRAADALMLYSAEGDKFVHVEMVRALKKEGCVPVAVLNGYRGIAHKDYSAIAVTKGGKRVIIGRHDVTELWDGQWEYSRNVVQQSVAGMAYNVHKDDNGKAVELTDEFVARAMKDQFGLRWRGGDEAYNTVMRERRMIQRLSHGFQGSVAFMKKDDAIVTIDYYNKPVQLEDIHAAAQGIIVMKDDAEWSRRVLGYNYARGAVWAQAVVQVMRLMKAYDWAQEVERAEMNAVIAEPVIASNMDASALEGLLAQADEAVATAVVGGYMRRRREALAGPEPVGAQEFRTVQNADGTISPLPVQFTPHMDVPIAHPDRIVPDESWIAPALAAAEAAAYAPNPEHLAREAEVLTPNFLLVQQATGIPTVFIDEQTVFPAPVSQE